MKTKKKKMKFNPDKAFRNFVILANIGTIGYLIYKIATCGIAWISTIRIFWIGGKRNMNGIKKVSYKYNNNLKSPITYYIQTNEITTSLNYKDALEIAYAVIDSLGGSYDYLDELTNQYEEV